MVGSVPPPCGAACGTVCAVAVVASITDARLSMAGCGFPVEDRMKDEDSASANAATAPLPCSPFFLDSILLIPFRLIRLAPKPRNCRAFI
jgi:hypothetical protein